MSEVSLYLSYDVLRSWPEFAAVEHLLSVGTPITLAVSMTGVEIVNGGEYIVGDIGENGIRFDVPAVAAS